VPRSAQRRRWAGESGRPAVCHQLQGQTTSMLVFLARDLATPGHLQARDHARGQSPTRYLQRGCARAECPGRRARPTPAHSLHCNNSTLWIQQDADASGPLVNQAAKIRSQSESTRHSAPTRPHGRGARPPNSEPYEVFQPACKCHGQKNAGQRAGIISLRNPDPRWSQAESGFCPDSWPANSRPSHREAKILDRQARAKRKLLQRAPQPRAAEQGRSEG